MAKKDIRNVTWSVVWFDDEGFEQTTEVMTQYDITQWDDPKEQAIFWCFDKIEAFRSELNAPNAKPLFKTFKFIAETTPSDLAW